MGLFTKSPRVAGMDTPWAVGTPGIGEGVPGYLPPLDVSLPEGVSAPAAAASEPGFFGKGRKLRDVLGYGLGAIAQQFGGQNPYQQQMDDDNAMKREMVRAELLNRFKVEADDRARRQRDDEIIDTFDTDNGDVMGIFGNGMTSLLTKGAGPKKTPLMQNFEWYSSLTPEQRAIADRSGLMGGNSEFAYGQKRGLKQVAPGKAPGAGGGSGRGVSATARAKYISEAQAAIAAGADPAKVQARLRKMGIN